MHMLTQCDQEISNLLADRMTNQDEDEVEDELEALERELNPVTEPEREIILPAAPEGEPQPTPAEIARNRAARRARERAAQTPMLAE
jgi:charged multivesicular body protein 6